MIGGLQGLGVMRYSAWREPDPRGDEHRGRRPVLLLGLGVERARRGLASPSPGARWPSRLALLLGRALPNAFLPSHRSAGRCGAAALLAPADADHDAAADDPLDRHRSLLGRLRLAAEVAVYAIAQRLLSPAQTVSTATGQMFAPRIAAEDARGDRSTLEVMLKRVTYWNVSLAIPVFALLLLVPEALLGVFGPALPNGRRPRW